MSFKTIREHDYSATKIRYFQLYATLKFGYTIIVFSEVVKVLCRKHGNLKA